MVEEDLKVDLRMMEEGEIVEIDGKGLSLVEEEMIVVENRVAYKVVEVDRRFVVHMASMMDAMVVYSMGNFGATANKVGVVSNLHTMDLG